jgi:hypothetical protein
MHPDLLASRSAGGPIDNANANLFAQVVGMNPTYLPTTSKSTGTLLRVACEYGQIFSCASLLSADAPNQLKLTGR